MRCMFLAILLLAVPLGILTRIPPGAGRHTTQRLATVE